MSGRRNRTKSTANPPAKSGQSSKQTPQPSKTTSSAPPAKPANAPKATSPPASKPTPSTRLRQEWKAFESWLSARRAERDKQINEKLKEVMSSKSKSRPWGKQSTASGTADMGAFEDKLNQDLADRARDEWWRRLEVAGLNEEDWTDMTEDEMKAVEAAFIPQQRGNRTVEDPSPPPPPQPVAEPPKPKPAVISKAGSSPFAARVEEESSIPGAWSAPSPPPVPEQGIMGRNRPYTPMARLAQQVVGRGVNKENNNGDTSASEGLWEAQMKKKVPSSDPQPSESLWDFKLANATTNTLDSTVEKLPTPETLWDMHMRKSTPKPPSPPPAEPEADGLWNKSFGKKTATPAPQLQPEPEYESFWDLQMSQSSGSEWPRTASPAPARAPGPSISTSKIPGPSRTPASSRSAVSSKNLAGKSPLSNSWDVEAELEEPSLLGSTVSLHTPASSTYTGDYGYVSPVFIEMEDEAFPRIQDPLPEDVVENSVRAFHSAAAEAEIKLRRKMVSGTLDDGALGQLVNAHMSAMEQYARKAVEEWRLARDVEVQRQRVAEEEKRRAMEAKKQRLGRRGGQTLVTEQVVRAASPALQMKKPAQIKNRQAQLLVESFGARPATPARLLAKAQQDVDSGTDLWERQMSGKAAEEKSMFSFLGSQAQPPPPAHPPIHAPSPWAQLAKHPTQRNPLLSQPAPAPAPEPSLSPWEAVMTKKVQAPPESQPQDAWDEDNTDESEEGAMSSWGQQMLNTARGGAASAWDMAMATIGGSERPGTPAQMRGPARPSAPAPAAPAAPASREAPWVSDGLFARSTSNGPTTPEDPRFATWRPPKIVDPDEQENPAKKMQDLAFQNLFQTADDDSDPTDLLNAMSMYTKATQSAARKKTAPGAQR